MDTTAADRSLLSGDVWELRRSRDFVVVPTNIGWRKDGANVMGRGLAAQAAKRHPDLPKWYGTLCQQQGTGTPTLAHPVHRLVLLPTKTLDTRQPWMSWRGLADVRRVQRSLDELVHLVPHLDLGSNGRILLPAVGCGNGGLTLAEIVPLLAQAQARESRISLVLEPPAMVYLPCTTCGGGAAAQTCTACRGTGQRTAGLLASFT